MDSPKLIVGSTTYSETELGNLKATASEAVTAARSLIMNTADGLTKQATVDLLSAANRIYGQLEAMQHILKGTKG